MRFDTEEFKRLFDSGASRQEISDAFGMSLDRVSEARMLLGLPTFPERDGRVVDRQQFRELHAEGLTAQQIADALGASKSQVHKIRKELALPPFAQDNPYRVDRELIRTLNSEGKSARQISSALGCSIRTVERVRRDLGIQKSAGVPGYSTEIKSKALAMLIDGTSYTEVSRTLGVGQKTLWRWYPNMGWSPKQTAEYRYMLKKLEKLDTAADRRIYSNL